MSFVVPYMLDYSSEAHEIEIDSTSTLTNVQMVENIVDEYHETHSYSEQDFFVCADMAIDVWNMVKTQGINAQIVVGNIDNQNANFTDYNHAWVLAETEPSQWIAIETTGGYLVYVESVEGDTVIKNDAYYHGIFFDNPLEFKQYMDLIKQYNFQTEDIIIIENGYNICVIEYEILRNEYNSLSGEERLSSDGFYKRDSVSQKLGECNTLASNLENEMISLTNIVTKINEII